MDTLPLHEVVMISLGLDPSLTGFGWCVHDSTKVGPERIVARGLFKTSAREIFVQRYKDLRAEVATLLRKYPQIECVGVESVTFGNTWSEGAYALFVMTNEAIYDAKKDVVYFDPLTVKLLAKQDPKVRKGSMFKSDMVNAAREDTGIRGRFNHNEADAYHIARFAARFWELDKGIIGAEDLTPSEEHAFIRTHTYKRGKRAGETIRLGAAFKEGMRFFRFSMLEKSHDGDVSRNG